MNSSDPYIKKRITKTVYLWNKDYPENELCLCGHPYYRHFDTYENMAPIGCKYCQCDKFKSVVNNPS